MKHANGAEMTTYETEVPEHAPDLRYDMGYTSAFSSTTDAVSNGLSYQNYDWTSQPQDAMYTATRAMYPLHENVDPHTGHYLGYPAMPQPEGILGSTYMPPTDIQLNAPMGHMPYPGYDTYYAQTYNNISPSSTGSASSTGSTGVGHGGSKPKRKRVQSMIQRKAANVRERRRMFHLNEAFDELRKRLPAFNYEKRLSRIETLRLAMTYIAFMKDVSDGTEPDNVELLKIQRKSDSSFSDDSRDSD